jgi:hypothetical protein
MLLSCDASHEEQRRVHALCSKDHTKRAQWDNGQRSPQRAQTLHALLGRQQINVSRPPLLQPRIYRFTLEREDTKDAFMDPPQRLTADEAFQPLDTQRKLT